MFILIPLGGIGQRFKDNKYLQPKALINIFGKPILYYLLESLNLDNIDFVYIPYNKEYSKFRFEDKLTKDFPNINFKFLKLDEDTGGSAETVNIAINKLTIKDMPVLCLDGDNFYTCDIIKLWSGKNTIFTFEDEFSASIYSYIEIKNNKIMDIVEKEKISNYACSGAYGFRSYKELLKYTQFILDNNIREKSEFYISTTIKQMLKNQIDFEPKIISKNNWHCLGTPVQLRQFYNNYPKFSCLDNNCNMKNMRICFDLDNTLVTFPKVRGDYSTVLPIQENINFLKYLYKFGNTIIIYTARRMKTHHGNIGKIMSDIGRITFDTLEKFDIPFDEIYFGKPCADVYIDDLAVNCFSDLEKTLGFYMDNIKPRSFNSLNEDIIHTYTKKSNDLSGEIYYYNNIPKEIKDLFPLLLDYDENNKWYKMEKINGLTATSLYLSELMTKDVLRHIMNTLRRIQSIPVNNQNINIYENYGAKLQDRFENYDYSRFPNYEHIYNTIYNNLNEYKGKISLIHGDYVMTNILINNFGKIKLIDMRGKVGETYTIYGDWLYDWAKLYQSLIGYDKILQNKNISKEYEQNMMQYFQEYFISLYSEQEFENLKTVTKSLLFSLIPMHDDDKCAQYFMLINKI